MKNKKNVLVIGQGRWGSRIIKTLKKISNIKYIARSKDNYKTIDLTQIDWVFILTPNETHYKIANYFIKKKINIFCEKPLTINTKEAFNLINLSKKNKIKLYVDDIEIYKNKKIKINSGNNYIIRTKKDTGSSKTLLDRLAYHDFYLLSKYIVFKNIKSMQGSRKNKHIIFKIILKKNIILNFYYDINSKIRKHLINNINFDTFKKDPMKDMLFSVLYKKINYNRNNENALLCVKLINKLKKIIN